MEEDQEKESTPDKFVSVRRVTARSLSLLARILGVRDSALIFCRDLLDQGIAYHQWETPKKSGGMRTITSPVDELKHVQRRILVRILNQIPVHFTAHGFVKEKDIVTNATEHLAARAMLNLDLKDAFPSVRTERVCINLRKPLRRILRTNYSDAISESEIEDILWMIVKLCTHEGCLPQGAPTSPGLLNIVCLNLDRELLMIALAHRLTLTRYADDITFSTEGDEIPPEIRQQIRATISRCGWKVNQKKTLHLQRSTGNALEVTGLLLQQNGKISVPPHRRENYKRYLETMLAREALEEQERMTIRGIIAYLARIYGRRLPSPFPKLWGKVKAKFQFQDSPAPNVHQVNAYMPDLPQGGGEE